MRYLALATDYDETLALHGELSTQTVDALERLKASGRRLLLVTGRELPDLLRILKRVDLFDRVVAENGGVLYDPRTRQQRALAREAPDELMSFLRQRKVDPLHQGRVLIATREPHQETVLKGIQHLGLEYEIIFNKGAVMALPSGVNKATGLRAALADLGLSPHDVVGIGDAENDHSFLRLCEASVAVANALPSLKEAVDWVTPGERDAGVRDLIDRLQEDDLASLAPKLARHDIEIGTREDGEKVTLPAYGQNLFVAGSSGGGKSSLVTALMERMVQHEYQVCVVDPEGDYEGLNLAVTVGSSRQRPNMHEVMEILASPGENVVLNLLAVPISDRPRFFADFMLQLSDLRVRTGRPHWLIIDEAHHVFPARWKETSETLPYHLTNTIEVTVTPDSVAPALLSRVTLVAAVGERVDRTIASFARAAGMSVPSLPQATLPHGVTDLWRPQHPEGVQRVTVRPARTERHRHARKYAVGDMGPDSFHFRGPDGQLDIPAHNLASFVELAAGVDDATWLYHLQRGDYARWFREHVNDDSLAREAEAAAQENLSPRQGRERIQRAIEERYTIPA